MSSLTPIFEITKIKVEKKKLPKKLAFIENTTINSYEPFVEISKQLIGDEEREIFLVGALNPAHELIAVYKAHIGTVSSCEVSPREVFKFAMSQGAAYVIFSHNHSSQTCSVSNEDVRLTERLVDVGKLIDIPVLDHIIVTKSESRSLRALGYVK